MPKSTIRAIKTAPAAKPVKPVAAVAVKPVAVATTAAPAAPKAAKPLASITRNAATIVAQRYPFGGLSERDNFYITHFATAIKANGGSVTLAQLAAGPRVSGPQSNKPNDAGAVIRLEKAGVITYNRTAQSIALAPKAATLAVATVKPVKPAAPTATV